MLPEAVRSTALGLPPFGEVVDDSLRRGALPPWLSTRQMRSCERCQSERCFDTDILPYLTEV